MIPRTLYNVQPDFLVRKISSFFVHFAFLPVRGLLKKLYRKLLSGWKKPLRFLMYSYKPGDANVNIVEIVR